MRKLFFILGILISITTFSQISSSNISGVVRDKNGKKIDHAKVYIYYKSKGVGYGTYTDINGLFRLYYIETGGPYKIRVEHNSYLPYEKRDLEFDLGDNFFEVIVEEKKNTE